MAKKAKYTDESAKELIIIAKKDATLVHEIRSAIRLIVQNPTKGKLVDTGTRIYVDPGKRFRVSYETTPTTKNIVVTIVNKLN